MRVGLIIEYDGAEFYGSQLQKAQYRTVQAELEASLHALYGEPIRVHFAGRTDRFVNATGQVAAYTPTKFIEPLAIFGALNDRLPPDLKVRHAQYVPDDFDPRHDATSRTYIYRLLNTPAPPVIKRNHIAHYRHALNMASMEDASRIFVGEHDFVAFAGPATPADASTVRQMHEITLARDGDLVTFTLTANAFLHQQVRRMVAALLAIGTGRLQKDALTELVRNGQKGGFSTMADAHGLTLESVTYPNTGDKLPKITLPNAE